MSGGTNPDQNRTTEMTYTADSQLKTLTARNPVTGDQITVWTYGTTLDDSDVASHDLLRFKQYPDGGGSDRVEYRYNRLGETKETKDQLGTVHVFDYDKLGRPLHDRVTALGAGVDPAVVRISRAYEARGLLETLTSYDQATAGAGSIVNQVQYEYNGFMLLIRESQAHGGAVTAATPSVRYEYADGSNHLARRTSTVYPDATRLELGYGSAGSADDAFNRVAHLQSGTAMGVDYRFLGLDRTVMCDYACEPSVELTYYAPGGSGEAGDPYTGLDRFGRVIDQRWRKTSDNSDRERVKYGFDRAGNRLWRQNPVAGTGQDEFYVYDGLYQIKSLQRGTLKPDKTGINGTPTWEEDWNYDPLGNWRGTSTAYRTRVNGSTSLNQNRTHNVANEITGLSTSSGPAWPVPVQNAVGNMTSAPQPLSLANSLALKWDAWNRLVEVKNGGAFLAAYAYDGANRRVTKLTGKEYRHYFYSDQWQVLEERTNQNSSADRRFFWGMRYIDDLICRDLGSERLYALHDYFSVTAVVDVNGVVQERYGYDGFGAVRYLDADFGPRSASQFSWETLYAAYRYDQESGLYQVRHRYLHPNLGRWLSRDPIEEEGGVNLYLYVFNSPINKIDFWGLEASDEGAGLANPFSCHRNAIRSELSAPGSVLSFFRKFGLYQAKTKLNLQYSECEGCCKNSGKQGKSFAIRGDFLAEGEAGSPTIGFGWVTVRAGWYFRFGGNAALNHSVSTCDDKPKGSACVSAYLEAGVVLSVVNSIGDTEFGGRGGLNVIGTACVNCSETECRVQLRACASGRARIWIKTRFFGRNWEFLEEFQTPVFCTPWLTISTFSIK